MRLKATVAVLALASIALSQCTNAPTEVDPNANTKDYVECDPNKVYFENHVLPILLSNCAMSGCHDEASKKEGVILTNYDDVMREVKAGNADGSELYEVLVKTNDDIMPPAPASPLSADQINTIKTWINDGAQNNYCSSDCDTTNLMYTTNIQNIITTNCVGCHQAPNPSAGIDLSTYSGVAAIAANGMLNGVVTSAANFSPMPPSGPMNDCNISAITKWVNAGYPEN